MSSFLINLNKFEWKVDWDWNVPENESSTSMRRIYDSDDMSVIKYISIGFVGGFIFAAIIFIFCSYRYMHGRSLAKVKFWNHYNAYKYSPIRPEYYKREYLCSIPTPYMDKEESSQENEFYRITQKLNPSEEVVPIDRIWISHKYKSNKSSLVKEY